MLSKFTSLLNVLVLLEAFHTKPQYAKMKTIEETINVGSGSVDAIKLGAKLQIGAPLTGELKTIAQEAKQFPKSMKVGVPSVPGFSPLYVGVGTIALANEPKIGTAAKIAGIIDGRPIVKRGYY